MGRMVVNLDKKVMLLVYAVLTLLLCVWMLFFVLRIMPIFFPLFPEKFWLMWLIVCPFFGPFMLFIFYIVVRITGNLWQFNRTQWKIAIFGTLLAFLYLSAWGFVFSLIIPADFEPFRSITLPSLMLALVFIIISRTKFIKKYQVTGKQS
jgi:hypothetical protein